MKYPPIPEAMIVPTLKGEGLPDTSGVYFVRDGGGSVIYVGQAIHLACRCTHTHEHVKHQHWWTEPRRRFFSFVEVPLVDLNFAECFYIAKCRPALNFGGKAFHKHTVRRQKIQTCRTKKQHEVLERNRNG